MSCVLSIHTAMVSPHWFIMMLRNVPRASGSSHLARLNGFYWSLVSHQHFTNPACHFAHAINIMPFTRNTPQVSITDNFICVEIISTRYRHWRLVSAISKWLGNHQTLEHHDIGWYSVYTFWKLQCRFHRDFNWVVIWRISKFSVR